MAKKKNKTQPTKINPAEFIAAVENEQKRKDAEWVRQMMEEVTGEPPKMWGPSIIGFGTYHYVYESGREGDWMLTGFSPRKTAMSVYLMGDLEEEQEILEKLGKHKIGKSCLYIKKLSDVDLDVLREIVERSVQRVRNGEVKL